MRNFLRTLSVHKWAVFMAVLIGLVMVFPQAYFRYENSDTYKGVEMNLGGADELFYLIRIREVRDGHWSIANPYWIEGKDSPYLRPPLLEIMANSPGWIFGLNLADTILFNRFFFPFLIFLLVYALVYCLFKEKLVSLIVSTTVMLSMKLADPAVFWNLLTGKKIGNSFLPFTRVVIPQIQSVFFFGFLLVFWLFLEKRKFIHVLASGVILGLSFYTYPYTWTFIYAFLGCLILIFICKRKWSEIKNIFFISVVSLLIGIPFFWNLRSAIQHPLYSELALRTGLIKARAPQVGVLILVLLAVFLLFFPRRRQWEIEYYFCLALVLAPFVVLNQQIITGYVMIPAHYHWYFHKPLLIIIVIMVVFYWFGKIIGDYKYRKACFSGLAGLILAVNFYYALTAQVVAYNSLKPAAIETQRYGPVLEWLNQNAQKDETVFTDYFLSDLVLVYTSLNSAGSLDAHYHLPADEYQLWQRMFLQYRFNGLKNEEAASAFFRDKVVISGNVYGEYYRKGWGGHENIPDDKINSMVSAYKDFLSVSLENILRKYQVKYIIWDTVNSPNWQIEQYSFLKEIYQMNGIKIYLL